MLSGNDPAGILTKKKKQLLDVESEVMSKNLNS